MHRTKYIFINLIHPTKRCFISVKNPLVFLYIFSHGELQAQVHRVTGAELWLLRVLGTQDVADTVEQLEVRLLRPVSQPRYPKSISPNKKLLKSWVPSHAY